MYIFVYIYVSNERKFQIMNILKATKVKLFEILAERKEESDSIFLNIIKAICVLRKENLLTLYNPPFILRNKHIIYHINC